MAKLTADIVIIGGGGAGIVTALTALEKGVTGIIVLEKRLNTGGNSALAGGFVFAVESPPQQRAGYDISRDIIFKETMAFHHYDRVNSRIIRAFINKTGDTMRWLEGKGIEYVWIQGTHDTHALKDLSRPTGGFGAKLKILSEQCREGGVQILLDTSGQKILREPDGPVIGVVAVDRDGEEVRINTRSVIIATGGFTGNKELLKKYFPFYYDEDVYGTGLMVSNMGEGIQLAEAAGAGINDYATLIREPIGAPRGSQESGRGSAQRGPGRLAADPRSLWVNSRGIRFLDENHGYENECSNAILWQPGKIAYALYDDELVQRIMEPEPIGTMPGFGNTPEQHIPDLRELLRAEAKSGALVCMSDSWDDIAKWIGADLKLLKATVEEYNAFREQRYDRLFSKDKRYLVPLRRPPYYAVKFGPMMIDTVGPVRVNELMEVLDKQDKPIPGLYAAGVIAGGWCGYDYHHFGCALSWALNSGRIAGESSAEYVQSM